VRARDVYRPVVATCAPGDRLTDVAKTMVTTDSGFVAILDEGRLDGVITERDLVRALAREPDPGAATAADHATRGLVTAAPDDDLSAVARRMVDADVRHLPVVDEHGELLGVVSMRDVFAVETLLSTQPEPSATA